MHSIAPVVRSAIHSTVTDYETAGHAIAYEAAAAYSLRHVGLVRQDVVKVRRSGDDAVTNFTADGISGGALAAWVTAGGGDKDGFVEIWYDQSGNNRHMKQSSTSNQPQIVDNGTVLTDLSSNPTVNFRGTSIAYLTSDTEFLTPCFAIVMDVVHNGFLRTFLGSTTSSDSARFDNNVNPDAEVKGNGVFTNWRSCPNDTNILAFWHDSGASDQSFHQNNASEPNTTSNTITSAGDGKLAVNRIGANQSATIPFNDDITEVIIYKNDQINNRTAIQDEINNHYGIYS